MILCHCLGCAAVSPPPFAEENKAAGARRGSISSQTADKSAAAKAVTVKSNEKNPIARVSFDAPPVAAAEKPLAEPLIGSPGWPRELNKVVLPTYRIEPPDILQIDAIHLAPKSPYRLRTLDTLSVQARGATDDAPINGVYPVEPGGAINLGEPYGKIPVAKLTVDEARAAIEKKLGERLKDPQATVALADIAASQQITGQHLVALDGTVTLGSYGSISVVGKTIEEAKLAIERHLVRFLDEPEISVTVFAYNSKQYYIITQGAGLGEGAARFPITGNETVLDAITQINGLASYSSTQIWVARPVANVRGCHQILPVDWQAITQCGDTESNYQLLPGDRVYVAHDSLVAFDTWWGKMLAPWERTFGFVSLGTQTVSGLKFFHQNGGRGTGNGF